MSEIGSVLLYVVSFLASFVLYKKYCKKDKKRYLLFAFLIPLLIGGLRFNVGTDYLTYYGYYEQEIESDLGFSIISGVSRGIGDYRTMFFIYNLLTLLAAFFGLKNVNKENRPLAYLCFLFLYYTTSFNAMRQMLAVCIVFCSYYYAANKKILPFVLFVLLATIFHTTAILSLIIYPLIHVKKIKYKALIGFAALLVVLNYQSIISNISEVELFTHYAIYENSVEDINFNNASFFIEAMVLAVMCILKKRGSTVFNKYSQYLFIAFIGVILLFSGFFSPYIKRIALYFTIVIPILLSCLPCVSKSSKRQNAIYMCVILYVIFRFIVTVYLLGHSGIIPYNMIEI